MNGPNLFRYPLLGQRFPRSKYKNTNGNINWANTSGQTWGILVLKNTAVLPTIQGLITLVSISGCIVVPYLWPDSSDQFTLVWIFICAGLALSCLPIAARAGDIIVNDDGIGQRDFLLRVHWIPWTTVQEVRHYHVKSDEWGQHDIIAISSNSNSVTVGSFLSGPSGWWKCVQELIDDRTR